MILKLFKDFLKIKMLLSCCIKERCGIKMFFKMFKKDLKNDVGLNIILFIFIVSAILLSIVSATVLYLLFTPESKTFDICKCPGYTQSVVVPASLEEKAKAEFEEYWNSNEMVGSFVCKDEVYTNSSMIDVENFDESSVNSFFESKFAIEYQDFNSDLVFDIDDKPFVLQSGEIAISDALSNMTGAKEHDHVYVTTDMGRVYEFEITHIYKEIYALGVHRLIISETDMEYLRNDSAYYALKYELDFADGATLDDFMEIFLKDIRNKDYPKNYRSLYLLSRVTDMITDTQIIMWIVSAFTMLGSLFFIIIILMTVRFTLVSAIDREQKELGMIKAIGADSFGFRWMFAAKYIGFFILGSAIGAGVGIPVVRYFLRLLCHEKIYPSDLEISIIAVICVIVIVFFFILCTMLTLRRIDKISVMEVIHGLDRGEQFGKISGLKLNKSKLPVSLFMAVSDIGTNFKKYIFLICAYILAFLIMLCTVNLRDTIMSPNFLKYMIVTQVMDFYPDFDEDLTHYYLSQGGDYYHMCLLINEEMEEAGIPAGYKLANLMYGSISTNNINPIDVTMIFGDYDTDNYTYREGTAPKNENEIAISYASAKKYGYKIGDVLKITYKDYSDPLVVGDKITGEFVITAFFDIMESLYDGPVAILSNSFENGTGADFCVMEISIDAPESEKPYYIEQIKELFGPENIKSGDEMMRTVVGAEYEVVLTSMRNGLSGIAIFVIVLITVLYGKVLVSAETPEIALLKSMGFTDGQIKRSKLLRGLLLLLISAAIAYTIHFCLGNLFIGVMMQYLDMTGFAYIYEPIKTFVIIPAINILSIMIILIFVQRIINRIQIWKIRED